MNLRAVEQERELKRQRTSKACGKQSSCCSNRLQSANYFDRRKGKSKQREWGGLFFWLVGHTCYRRWRNRTRPKTVKNAECQTIEFDYMFQTSRYQAPNKDLFWLWCYSSFLHWATHLWKYLLLYSSTSPDMSHSKRSRSTDFKCSLLYLWNLD